MVPAGIPRLLLLIIFIFEKAAQIRQPQPLLAAFHLDKALYSTKDNIFFPGFPEKKVYFLL